jgi:hypothetical protein
MKKLISTVLIIAALLGALAFADGGGQAWPINFYGTVQGMRAAAADQPGTFIYAGNNLYMLAWPIKSGNYAFSVINQSGSVVDSLMKQVNATGTTVYTMADLVKWMEANGFKRVLGQDLPVNIGQVLLGQVMASVASGSRAFITIVVFPAGVLELPDFSQRSVQ